MRATLRLAKSRSDNSLRRGRPSDYKYQEMSRWQRQAQGLTKWEQSHSHRQRPMVHRFNPEGLGLTKGTSSFAWQWWYTQQAFLPQTAPEGYVPPQPMGKRPASWDDEFTDAVLSLSDDEVRQYALEQLTKVIFEETQRDGYELRRVNFEGKPLTELPEAQVIEHFVFEEESLRERVIRRIVEGTFRLSPTSEDRLELKTTQHVLDFVCAHVIAAREPPSLNVTDRVRNILAQYHMQPVLGFSHALPQESPNKLLVEWERLHHVDWQFGKAVYEPRFEENKVGNLVWLREAQEDSRRDAFREFVASGEAKAAHLQKIADAAAANDSTTMSA